MPKTLAELATLANAELKGDANLTVTGVATLSSAGAGHITFLSNPKYRKFLSTTKASAVILSAAEAALAPCAVLVAKDPYYAYALIASALAPALQKAAGVHSTAVIESDCVVDPTAHIGAKVVLSKGVHIGAHTVIEPGCVLNVNVVVGENCHLYPNVTLYAGVRLGDRVIIHSGAVLGSDGFGFAHHQYRWHKVPQLGSVRVGNDVEIGANTTIDCGAIDDTVIEDGVKLDNQIQIGHNVHIGAHTIMAGCSGVAGSTTIGKHCMIGGASGIAGHLTIADGTILTAGAEVSNSIENPGVYSSGTALMDNRTWRKNAVRFRHLDELFRKLLKTKG